MSNTVSTLLGAPEGIVKFAKMAGLSPLGAGGMGEIYKARDTRLEESQKGRHPFKRRDTRQLDASSPLLGSIPEDSCRLQRNDRRLVSGWK